MIKQVKIIIKPDNKEGFFSKGTVLHKALYSLGIIINSSCGGSGKCGKCVIQIISGASPYGEIDKKFINKQMLEKGYRLACQTKIMKNMSVIIPPKIRKFITQAIYEKQGQVKIEPFVRKRFIEFPSTAISHNQAYFDVVKRALGVELHPGLNLLRETRNIPSKATLVTYGDELIDIEEGDTTSNCFGIAIDIGTSTISALLIDLGTGKTLSREFSINPQVAFGDDVISRIDNALKKDGLCEIQKSVVSAINRIIQRLIKTSNVDRKNIYEITFVGNTCMHHLFLGIPPNSLAVYPYIPLVRQSLYINSDDIGIKSLPHTRCYIFPNIAGYVGGDTVGAILTSGMLRSKKITLLIDIGTNGEIVLGSRESACSVSCAAGPAFEGIHISCGMPAYCGAIEGVEITDGDIRLKVIGNTSPEGLCGSGLIDALAQLLRLGIINKKGRLKKGDKIMTTKDGIAFSLTRNVYITQRDIRQLQLAKGAILAGIELIKKHMNLKNEDIDRVMIAGAFGNYLRRDSIKEIGLIPESLLDRINFIGNAALKGARLVLLSKRKRKEAEFISKKVEYIELMAREDFGDEFVNALNF
ncbi:DUF4445 domain-containing protein [candidate division WOR-3 bacterium]|nr:DUF4445 domain-containing protein [candidate division WOR-3 bacterium]